MDTQHNHPEHTHQVMHQPGNNFSLATRATLHCLMGCGIGEVLAIAIAAWLKLSVVESISLAIILSLATGFTFGVLRLMEDDFSFAFALKATIVGEGISIAVMETFILLTPFAIPYIVTTQPIYHLFEIKLTASLAVGFIAALPVNYFMIKKGVRHVH